MSFDAPTVHGTALMLEGCGVLIQGSSGAGKSRLALALLDQAGCHVVLDRQAATAQRSALVGDDRLTFSADDGTLYASVPETIAGKLEVRGLGIVNLPWVARARLHLVVYIVPLEIIERMPDAQGVTIKGCTLSQLQVPRGDLAHQVLLVRTVLHLLRPQ
jgi:HPr kinase/phosphorylase